MRRKTASLIGALVLAAAIAAPVAADTLPPCNDADGDGKPSGREYAAHHVSQLAQSGMLGSDGHQPGTHRGFSLCLGVHADH